MTGATVRRRGRGGWEDTPGHRLVVLLLTLLGAAGLLGAVAYCGRAAPPPVTTSRPTSPTQPTDPHQLAKDVPVRLAVPSVRIDVPVMPVGRTKGGAMAVPKGAMTAGWFRLGTYPGDKGSAVIAGHSGFRVGRAAFDPMPGVRDGDPVYVRTRSGQRLTFRVVGRRNYPADAQAPEVFGREDGEFLNLVSCVGSFNTDLGTHSERLVVFTKLSQ